MQIPFIGGAYQARGSQLNAQECINLYPELDESGEGKSRGALIGTPGLTSRVTATDGNRGLYRTSTGRLYAVRGTKLYEISTAWASTEIGTLDTATGNVSMADNGTQLMVVDGTSGYIVTLATNAFAKITDADYPTATHVAFQDQYFIVNESGTGKFYISALTDGSSWDALDFATAEGSADNLIGVYSNGENLFLFGSDSTEVWYNNGDSTFTFGRVPGAHLDIGCVAAFSPAIINDRVYWLGGSGEGYGTVWVMQGYQPQRISTHAIEYDIGQMSDISDAVGWAYQQEGHSFYVLTFPTGNKTYCYDAKTGLWHRRAWLDPNTKNIQQHLGLYHAFFNNQHVIADRRNGNLYTMSLDVYSDAGDEMLRRRTLAHVSNEAKRMRYNSFQVDMEVGVGLQSGQGSDPQVMMQYSNDGGKTWSNELWTSFGSVGEYSERAIWRKLGAGRDRVFKVEISDPVQVHLTNAYIDAQPME